MFAPLVHDGSADWSLFDQPSHGQSSIAKVPLEGIRHMLFTSSRSSASNNSATDHCTSETRLPGSALEVAGKSDVGRSREINQDHYLVADLQRLLQIRDTNVAEEECQRLFASPPGHLLVVADGMGGHASGEVASSTAVGSCARYVIDMMQWFIKLSESNEEDFRDELSECLRSVQRRLWSKSNGARRMGTTVTMAYILWPRMYVVHAGDSRCYVLRNGDLQQVTTDHTLAQQMVDSGAIAPEEAATSRWRHVLWNCVGGSDRTVQPEVTKVVLQPSDRILLCSDGLTGMIEDGEIQEVLESLADCRSATDELVRRSNEAGGKDNITVIVGQFHEPKPEAQWDTNVLHDTDVE